MIGARVSGLVPVITALFLGCSQSATSPEPIGSSAAAIEVCPMSTTLEGVDVSSYQGTIDWTLVKSSGRAFGIARVSDGTQDPDSTFAANWTGMKSAGLVRGVYQYFRASESPTAQATLLISAIGSLQAGDLPPVADVETLDGESGATLVKNLATWVAAITRATGRTPIIYAAEGFWDALPSTSQFSDVTLWVANWQVSCPDTPTPWTTWSVWQYDDNGTVAGISGAVDTDKWNGTLAELNALASGGTVDGGASSEGDAGSSPAGTWGASYVSQTFPLATTALTLTAGDRVAGSITLKNIGSHAWGSSTKIATTEPENRVSVFADQTWLAPDRPAGVTGSVATGDTYTFSFTLLAPETPGTYDEHFGVVEEGVSWFSAPGQLGPADDDLEVQIHVLPGEGGVPDGGAAGRDEAGVLVDGAADADGSFGHHSGGCRVGKAHDGSAYEGLGFLGVGLFLFRRRLFARTRRATLVYRSPHEDLFPRFVRVRLCSRNLGRLQPRFWSRARRRTHDGDGRGHESQHDE